MMLAEQDSQPTVLVVEDDESLREALCDTLMIAGYEVTAAGDGKAALNSLKCKDVSMVISDVNMAPMDGHTLLKELKSFKPRIPVLLMTAYGTIEKAVEAMHDGAIDYLVKPFEAQVLVNMVNQYVSQGNDQENDFISVDNKTKELKELAKRLAASDATIMITGESGSGKEVLARFIHNQSARKDKAFVAINCAAIPSNMLEATLFGYEKGAFTGAYKASPGKFEQAQGGTLLLDEISEMEQALQAKLLRVLQEREVERLGSSRMLSLDVRVLATSNRDMQQEVRDRNFREDLFYRLNVFPVNMPPLQEHKDDITAIATRVIERVAANEGRAIPVLSNDARDKLLSHSWPGNVRELDNVMQRAMILTSGDEIRASNIMFENVTSLDLYSTAPAVTEDVKQDDLKASEQSKILDVLKACMGNRSATAAKLGISQRTLRYKLARMRDHGINIPGVMGRNS
ncbi:MAG: sigma-54 dependent transcriptional regulator [Gammaproteobacteria bacterium]|nr:MAG: sigma-54 dependent transcriptional regulator [Gammaproteobacteria bacterium]